MRVACYLLMLFVTIGYRHIHLTYAGCRDERIGNATLFVHVQIQDYVAHKVILFLSSF